MIDRERWFLPLLGAGLLLCGAFYAEEAIHFIHYGGDPTDYTTMIDVLKCEPVPGDSAEVECPIRGYGRQRYRYQDTKHPAFNKMTSIDRNQ